MCVGVGVCVCALNDLFITLSNSVPRKKHRSIAANTAFMVGKEKILFDSTKDTQPQLLILFFVFLEHMIFITFISKLITGIHLPLYVT